MVKCRGALLLLIFQGSCISAKALPHNASYSGHQCIVINYYEQPSMHNNIATSFSNDHLREPNTKESKLPASVTQRPSHQEINIEIDQYLEHHFMNLPFTF